MANLEKKVVRTGKPGPGSTVPEGTIIEVVTDEKILDPNDPRAVSTPAEGLGGSNPIAGLVAQSPNEVDGSGPSPQVNPHTGEVVVGNDANPTETSPVPANVATAESVDDLVTAEDVAEQNQPLSEAVDEVVAENGPTPAPAEPSPPAVEGDTENPPTNPDAVEPTPDPAAVEQPVESEPVPTEPETPVEPQPSE